jgi:hypothetical protein
MSSFPAPPFCVSIPSPPKSHERPAAVWWAGSTASQSWWPAGFVSVPRGRICFGAAPLLLRRGDSRRRWSSSSSSSDPVVLAVVLWTGSTSTPSRSARSPSGYATSPSAHRRLLGCLVLASFVDLPEVKSTPMFLLFVPIQLPAAIFHSQFELPA